MTPTEITSTQPPVRSHNIQRQQGTISANEKLYHNAQRHNHLNSAARIENQHNTSYPCKGSKEMSASPMESYRPSHRLERLSQRSYVQHVEESIDVPEPTACSGQTVYLPFENVPLPNILDYDFDAARDWIPCDGEDELPYFKLEYATTEQDEIDRIQPYQGSIATVNDPNFFCSF